MCHQIIAKSKISNKYVVELSNSTWASSHSLKNVGQTRQELLWEPHFLHSLEDFCNLLSKKYIYLNVGVSLWAASQNTQGLYTKHSELSEPKWRPEIMFPKKFQYSLYYINKRCQLGMPTFIQSPRVCESNQLLKK